MPTSNQAMLDAIVRHQVDILRFSKGETEKVLAILDQADAELVQRISNRIGAGLSPLETSRLEALLADVKRSRTKALKRLDNLYKKDLADLAVAEGVFEGNALESSLDFVFNSASVPAAKLQALANAPIRGIPIDGWVANMAQGDVNRLQGIINLAIIEGATPQSLIRQVTDALGVTRRNAEALTRTAVNHVSNKARESVWDANADIIDALRWTATLDGRTSPICQSRDGDLAPVGDNPLPPGDPLNPPGARPPAHFNCRSVMVAVIDGESAIGDRTFIRDRRRPKERLADFRKEARAKVGADKWRKLSPAARNKLIAKQRDAWAKTHIGTVPAKQTYEQWLRKQPTQFQNEVLGNTKGKLFRQGASLDKFVDKSGRTLTLAELKAAGSEQTLALSQPGIGLKAKALLQQGLSNDQVLKKILTEFPDANTTAASIASYKSNLKKAGLLNVPGASAFGANKTLFGQGLDTASVVTSFTAKLPEGVRNAIGNGWYSIVDDLSGGHIAHYKPGIGVEISAKKLASLSPVQAEQVLAHELGHMLHKTHPKLKLGSNFELKNLAKSGLTPDGKKNYSYYVSKGDELHAEVYAQALSPSPMTSQGLVAKEFNQVFDDLIIQAKAELKEVFPPLKTTYTNGTTIPGSGLVAGNPQSYGVTGYIKELLKQNMNGDDILKAVQAEFPAAKTTKASIASTKSVMKKKGQLGSPSSKATIHNTNTPKPLPIEPTPAPKVVTAQDAAAKFGLLDDNGVLKANFQQSVFAQKSNAKKVLLEMLNAGVTNNNILAKQIADIFPKSGMKATNVASFKTNWKKKGLWGPGKTTVDPKLLKTPELKVNQLGSHSKKGLIEAEKLFANGATHQQVESYFSKHFGGDFDALKGAPLIELAEYNAKIKKFTKHNGAKAVHKPTTHKPKVAAVDMTPIRKATSPHDGWPPPPRFDEAQRQFGIEKILGRGTIRSANGSRVNQALKKAGLEELTDAEYSVLRSYTGGGFQRLNNNMRVGSFSSDLNLQAAIDAGQHGLRKMRALKEFHFKGIVNRGTTLSGKDFENFKNLYVKGAIIEEHAFVSTSTNSGFGGRIRFRIQSATGVKVRVLSQHPGEAEVLFAPGVRFKVDNITFNDTTRETFVELTELSP